MNKSTYALFAIAAASLLASATEAATPVRKATRAKPRQDSGAIVAPSRAMAHRILSFKRLSETGPHGMHASGQAKGARFQVEVRAGGERLNSKLIVKRLAYWEHVEHGAKTTITSLPAWMEPGDSKTFTFWDRDPVTETGCSPTRYLLELEGTGAKRTALVTPTCQFVATNQTVQTGPLTDMHGRDPRPHATDASWTAPLQCHAAWPIKARILNINPATRSVRAGLYRNPGPHPDMARSTTLTLSQGQSGDAAFITPFTGQAGSFWLQVISWDASAGNSGANHPRSTVPGPLKLHVSRTCRLDSGQLEP